MTRIDSRLWKTLLVGAAVSLATGCGQPGQGPTAPVRAASGAAALQADRPEVAPKADLGLQRVQSDLVELTPEKAEEKARERAAAWQADAELRFVGWGVAKWELLSAVSHVFYSPASGELMVVNTFLRDKWQKAYVYDHKVVTAPAKILQPLDAYRVDGHQALKLSKKYFSFWNKRPVSLVTLTHPEKLPFAFWGVVADKTVVLVHANTGQSLSPRGFDPFPKEWLK